MKEAYILFWLDDEYGHCDIWGVFSSKESLVETWNTLLEKTQEHDKYLGRNPYHRNLNDFDAEVEKARKGNYCISGEQYFWKKVEMNTVVLGHEYL